MTYPQYLKLNKKTKKYKEDSKQVLKASEERKVQIVENMKKKLALTPLQLETRLGDKITWI